MVDKVQTTLTPEEAGAFVAQWAEQHKVGVDELAERLGVSEPATTSLMRQAKGRLAMDRWLHEKQPRVTPVRTLIAPVLVALAIGGVLGTFITGYLIPPTGDVAARPLPRPTVEVTTSLPTSQPNAAYSPPEVGVPPRASFGGRATGAQDISNGPSNGRNGISSGKKLQITQPPSAVTPHSGSAPQSAPKRDDTSFTDLSRSLGMALPKDLVVAVQTPFVNYIFRGKGTRTYQNAQLIQDADMRASLHAALGYLAKQDLNPGQPKSADDKSAIATIILRVGRATAQKEISWSAAGRKTTLQLIEYTSSPFYSDLVNSVLKQIREDGPSLFGPQGVPAMGRG